jgi:hypothetical protein
MAFEKVRAVALRTRFLMFIGNAPDRLAAKTADGVALWRPEICPVRAGVGAIVDDLPA